MFISFLPATGIRKSMLDLDSLSSSVAIGAFSSGFQNLILPSVEAVKKTPRFNETKQVIYPSWEFANENVLM